MFKATNRTESSYTVPRISDFEDVSAESSKLQDLKVELDKLERRMSELHVASKDAARVREIRDAAALALLDGEELEHDGDPISGELKALHRREPILKRAIELQEKRLEEARTVHRRQISEEAMEHARAHLERIVDAVQELNAATNAYRVMKQCLASEGISLPQGGGLPGFPLDPKNGVGAGFVRDLRERWNIEVNL